MTHSNIQNSRILVTGANGGIGIETVRLLIQKKASSIVLACRTLEKAELTKSRLSPSSDTKLDTHGGFDMANADSIETAVDRLRSDQQFDIVFLQSGGMIVSNDFQFVENGEGQIERTIYQNVLGGYLTLKYLNQRNLIAPNARIVFAGGEGARGIKGMIERPEFNSANDLRNYVSNGRGKYSDINALGASKFMAALLVQKLAVVDSARQYVWFSPGLTGGTNGLDNVPNPKRFVFKYIGFPMMQLFGIAQSPRKAARKYVDCLDGKYGTNGDLIGAPEGKTIGKLVDQKPMNPGLTNHQFRDVFWDIATMTCGEYMPQFDVVY